MKIFEEIKNTGGSIEKQKIAIDKFTEKHFEIMHLCFNQVVYGISKKGIAKAIGYDEKIHKKYQDLGEFLEEYPYSNDIENTESLDILVEKLKNTSGDEQIKELKDFLIFKTRTDDMSWIIRAIQKNMRIGISLKSHNKILKARGMKEIKVKGVQLCGKAYMDSFHKLSYPRLADIKYDGERTIVKISKKNDILDIILTSRANNDSTEHFPEIIEKLKYKFENTENGFSVIYDSEIISSDFNSLSKRMHRKAENITEKDESLDIVIFDILEVGGINFRNIHQFDRRCMLENHESRYDIKLSISITINNKEQLKSFYESAIKNKQEGVVTKDTDMIWEEHSRKGWYKIVPKENLDLKIIDCYYGNGKFVNQINGVVVENKDGTIKSDASSGISDFDRELLTKLHNENELIGRIVEISFRELQPSKDGVSSLKFPVFVRIRDDKNESD